MLRRVMGAVGSALFLFICFEEGRGKKERFERPGLGGGLKRGGLFFGGGKGS